MPAALVQVFARRRGWIALVAVSATALSVGYAKRFGRATFSVGGAFSDTDESVGVGFGLGL